MCFSIFIYQYINIYKYIYVSFNLFYLLLSFIRAIQSVHQLRIKKYYINIMYIEMHTFNVHNSCMYVLS